MCLFFIVSVHSFPFLLFSRSAKRCFSLWLFFLLFEDFFFNGLSCVFCVAFVRVSVEEFVFRLFCRTGPALPLQFIFSSSLSSFFYRICTYPYVRIVNNNKINSLLLLPMEASQFDASYQRISGYELLALSIAQTALFLL